MGEYPAPAHYLVHMSDPHLIGGQGLLYDQVDSEGNLRAAMERLVASAQRPEAVIFTGDLADTGSLAGYAKLRSIVEPACEAMGAQVIWAMGNHDDRMAFRAELLGQAADGSPIDMVYTLGGLRVIVLDTSVPGWHHGELGRDQLEWLAAELYTDAPEGTILVMHHPPVPCVLPIAVPSELRQQRRFGEVLVGSDVRAILAGHLHYSTNATFRGIPVSVAAATCYNQDLLLKTPKDAGQAFNLVHVYEDTIMHSAVPLAY